MCVRVIGITVCGKYLVRQILLNYVTHIEMYSVNSAKG